MKEYGNKLTPEQFKALIGSLPTLRGESEGFDAALRALPQSRLDALLGQHGGSWALVYERPFSEHLA
jgi:hypothetical protein